MLFAHTNMAHIELVCKSLSIKWNSMSIGGPAHGIVTKTAHKTLPVGGRNWVSRGGGSGDGLRVGV